jgi:hypothetical protein
VSPAHIVGLTPTGGENVTGRAQEGVGVTITPMSP